MLYIFHKDYSFVLTTGSCGKEAFNIPDMPLSVHIFLLSSCACFYAC